MSSQKKHGQKPRYSVYLATFTTTLRFSITVQQHN